MFKSNASTGYVPVAKSSDTESIEGGEPLVPEAARSNGTVVLLCIAIVVSCLSLLRAGVTIYAFEGRASSPAVAASFPSVAPKGTLGSPFEYEDGDRVPQQELVSAGTLAAAEPDSLRFSQPASIAVMQRSKPYEVLYNATHRDMGSLFLNYDSDNKVEVLSTQHFAQVWNMSLTSPLDPSIISYMHRPPRRQFLGELDFTVQNFTSTNAFHCPTRGEITVLIQCRQKMECGIRFQQGMEGHV